MHRGYTKRWRKRWDKKYHLDSDLWLLMDYFIDFANHRDSNVYFPGCGLIPLKRGQHIFGTPQISAFLGWDRSLTRRKLKILKNIGFLTIRSTNKYSIATIINYDTYQANDYEIDHQTDPCPTSKRPANDQQTTTPNKLKNVNNDKNEKKTIVLPDWLDQELWSEYKRYRSNGKNKFTPYAQQLAIKKLTKLREDGNDPNEVIQQTMVCNWSGFFPLKSDKSKQSNLPKGYDPNWRDKILKTQ